MPDDDVMIMNDTVAGQIDLMVDASAGSGPLSRCVALSHHRDRYCLNSRFDAALR